MKPSVKICCIMLESEARLAMDMGADVLGLVGPMPSGPGTITEAEAAALAQMISPPAQSFFLTSENTADALAAQLRQVRPTALQVVSPIDPIEYRKLDALLPREQLLYVQVIHIEDRDALDLIDRYANVVDAFLLDSGRPSAQIPEFGGTGRVHDWSISAEFVRRSPLPVYLAGGLNPDNVTEAINAVRPYGVDLCSGVRTDGRLDAEKLEAFMAAVGR